MYAEDKVTLSEEEWKKLLKKDLEPAILQCSRRGLIHTTQWQVKMILTVLCYMDRNQLKSVLAFLISHEF